MVHLPDLALFLGVERIMFSIDLIFYTQGVRVTNFNPNLRKIFVIDLQEKSGSLNAFILNFD